MVCTHLVLSSQQHATVIQSSQLDLVKVIGDQRVIEVEPGTGRLMDWLNKKGVNIKGIQRLDDKYTNQQKGKYATKLFVYGDAVNYIEHNASHYDVVLMTWPCYESPHAELIARSMHAGQILIFQGEDCGGCCADDGFFEYLDANFLPVKGVNEELSKHALQYEGLHDVWMVCQKVPNHGEKNRRSYSDSSFKYIDPPAICKISSKDRPLL